MERGSRSANPSFPEPFANLVEAFRRLPGIGTKTATRLAFHLLVGPDEERIRLAETVEALRSRLSACSACRNIVERDQDDPEASLRCFICMDPSRDHAILIVVEDIQTLYSLEKSGEFKGLYHVLEGRLSPLEGVNPDRLRIRELMARLSDPDIREVVLATSPTTDGEATALYLSRLIKPMGIRVSRIAFGIPVGLEIEYVDEVTLIRAVEGRHPF
ncbi:MAG: recombination mediator RecR [Nitrospirota bacterium]|nr:recombination mediator RecR [Nitrospirota bacterium]